MAHVYLNYKEIEALWDAIQRRSDVNKYDNFKIETSRSSGIGQSADVRRYIPLNGWSDPTDITDYKSW